MPCPESKRCSGSHDLIEAFDKADKACTNNIPPWQMQKACSKFGGIPTWLPSREHILVNFSYNFLCVSFWSFQSEIFKATKGMRCHLLMPLEFPPIQRKLDQQWSTHQLWLNADFQQVIRVSPSCLVKSNVNWLAKSPKSPSSQSPVKAPNSPLAFQRQLVKSCQVRGKNKDIVYI